MFINNSLLIKKKSNNHTFSIEVRCHIFFVLGEVVDFHVKLSYRVSESK